ncbi:EamA domain-containing membrane protein RarD [Epibacterium ulvae]|uniref:EamA domain-containing membrane protein RarD n=1 Tax=Epibacterium ulvae TaxID=1156985 RepID=A0A1G5PKN2_9RHOB|nr:EamA family transporter [Epibacterium ulvae]SCZ50008.1 EamA domain-containing membrane protein RarD [Epibacterium ulvae]
MPQIKATAIGFIAILLWALLALFTVGSAPVPPLLLNAICFTLGGGLGLLWSAASGNLRALRQVPWTVYGLGALGLFGYHALYFSALRLAPAAEAGLIAYLWPLLIVLLSGLLPGETLRKGHYFGAILGFCGAALIVSGGGAGFQTQYLPGYGLALLCALTWSGYSVLSRRFASVPTSSVALFCLLSAVASWGLHFLLEDTRWPDSLLGWGSVLGLGLGPVGLAFFVWDIGVKQGNIQVLGTLSYATPLLSTLVLVMAGIAQLSISLGLAAILITLAALCAALASKEKGPSKDDPGLS